MKRLLFKQKNAQRIYDDYFKRVESSISILPADDKQDALMEINSHFYEGLQQNANEIENEIEILLDIIEKLGAPEEIFKPMVAERKLKQAVKTFNPKHVVQAFLLNLNKTAILLLVSLLSVLSLGLVFTIITKLIAPGQTGLFVKNNNLVGLGFSSTTNLSGAKEVLGYWYIPMALLVILIAYFATVFLIRLIFRK